MKRHLLLITLALLALGSAPSHAVTKTWTGQSGGLWSTSANWSPVGAPADNDSLNFPLVSAGRVKTMTNDLSGRTFTDLTFTINGYTLRGNALTLSDGINAAQSTLGNVIDVPITLSGHQTFNVANGGGTLLLSGNLNLNRANLSFGGAGSVNLSGIISNRGSVVIVGSNTVTLFGTASNRFDGTTWVQNGTLILNKVSGGVGQIAVPGDLIIGTTKPATVRLSENNQIAPDAAVTIHEDCVLDLDGQTNTVGSLLFHGGGTVQTGVGQLRLGGNVTVESAGEVATITGNLYLGNTERTFTVGDVASGLDLDIPAAISAGNSGAPFYFGVGFIKAGAGLMRLAGANTHGGLTVVNDGELHVSHSLALGADGGLLAGTRVNSNALLRLESVHVGNEPLTLNKAATLGHALFNFGNSSWSGPVTLSTDSKLWSGGTLVFSNVLSGAGGLFLDGETFELAGSDINTYSGVTESKCRLLSLRKSGFSNGSIPGTLFIGGGAGNSNVVRHGASHQIANTALVSLSTNAVLDLNNYNDAVGGMEFSGGRVGTGSGLLTLGGDVVVFEAPLPMVALITGGLSLPSLRTFDVRDSFAIDAAITGAGGIVKTGALNMDLHGSNSFTGLTVVQQGDLRVAHPFALGTAASGTVVSNGATLSLSEDTYNEAESLVLSGHGDTGSGWHEGVGALYSLGYRCVWAGPIVLNGDTKISVWRESEELELNGTISGTGNLIKAWPGTLILGGGGSNSFSGSLILEEGNLRLSKTAAQGAIPNGLVVGPNTVSGSNEVRFTRSQQIADTARVVLHPRAVLNLSGYADWIGALEFRGGTSADGGDVTTGAGYLGIHTSLVASNGWPGSLAGQLRFGAGTRLVIAEAITVSPEAMISEGGFILEGGGKLVLAGFNTFAGAVRVEAGRLVLRHDLALGASSAGTTVVPGGALLLEPTLANLNEPLALSGDGVAGSGALAATSTALLTAGITLAGDTSLFVETNRSLTLQGVVTGTGNLTKLGAGTLALTGTAGNTFAGDLYVAEGRLEMNKANANSVPQRLIIGGFGYDAEAVNLGNSEVNLVTVRRKGQWNLSGFNDSVTDLVLTDGGDVSAPLPGRLLLSTGCDVTVSFGLGVNGSSTLAGVLELTDVHTFSVTDQHVPVGDPLELAIPALMRGDGTILKTGSGNVRLSASNSFTGNLSIQGGQVHVAHNSALGTGAGGTLVLNNASLILEPGVSILHETLTLNSTGLSDLPPFWAAGETNLWDGLIGLQSAARVGVASNGTLRLTGEVGGAGNLTFEGPGKVVLSGPTPNTYVGTTQLKDGLLELGKSVPPAIPGTGLIIGDGLGAPASANVRELATSQIGDLPVTVEADGLLDLNGESDTIGTSLTLNQGGDVQTGAGMLLLANGNTVTVNHDGSMISGRLHLGTTTSSITVAPDVSFDLGAEVRGTATITKRGAGSLSLAASNSFTGPLEIAEGPLWASHSFALGRTNAGTTVLNHGWLALAGQVSIGGELLTLAGNRPAGSVCVFSETNVWDGPVLLASDAVLCVSNEAQLTMAGAISGPAGWTKIGQGTLVLSGGASNSYAGTTWLVEGITEGRKTSPHGAIPGELVVGNPDTNSTAYAVFDLYNAPQIHALSPVVVHRRGRIVLDDVPEQAIGSLAGSGSVRIDYGTNMSRLIFGGDNRSTVFSGSISDDSRRAQFVKRGQGEFLLEGHMRLEGTNDAFRIEAGTVRMNGYISSLYMSSGGHVRVLPGATLSGNGGLPSVTVSGGTLSPGAEPGRSVGMFYLGHLSLESNAVVEMDIQGIASGQQDNIWVSDSSGDGVLSITNASLRVFLAGPPVEGEALVIIVARSYPEVPIQGQFLGFPEGALLALPPFTFQISYTPDRDDYRYVTLTMVNPPLQSGPAQVVGNNAQPGRINENECDALYIPLTNTFAWPLSGIRAVLTSPSGGVLVTQPESQYPDLPPGGVGTNLTPFQISIPEYSGGGLDLELGLTSSGPAFSSAVQLESGLPGPLERFDNPTNYILPKGATVEIPIQTGYSSWLIEEVRVSLHLTHENVGDLEISLVAPDGQSVLLSRSVGGTNDSYGTGCGDRERTTFRDSARTVIDQAAPPFAGVFRPLETLGKFFGRRFDYSDDGPWRLRIVNRGHSGSLECWSIYISERDHTRGTGECLTCVEPIQGTLTTNHPIHSGALNLWFTGGPATTCTRPRSLDVTWDYRTSDTNGNDIIVPYMSYYETHAFTNAGPAMCVGVAFVSWPLTGWGEEAVAVAYLDAFNPNDPTQNHLGDIGYSGWFERTFSFNVPVGARFVIVVSSATVFDLPTGYTLKVTGGDCPPPALTIAPATSPDKVAVSWTSASGGYQLESTSALSPAQFTRVTNGPALVDGQFVLTNNATGAGRFYRLHKP